MLVSSVAVQASTKPRKFYRYNQVIAAIGVGGEDGYYLAMRHMSKPNTKLQIPMTESVYKDLMAINKKTQSGDNEVFHFEITERLFGDAKGGNTVKKYFVTDFIIVSGKV